jgi:flagellar hook-associated protein 1 FlgK
MAGLLNIGLTGLNAAQAQLSTVSHNITNADRQGYHRQTVGQSYQNPMFVGSGFFGQGTRITDVSRSYNQHLETQVLQSDTRRAEYAAYNQHVSQINNLLADPDAGLAPLMESFFAGVQEVATNPTSVASRQALISNAQSLVSGFQSIDQRLSEVRQGIEGELVLTVDGINNYATQIADINKRIVLAQSGSTAVPNDLLDQRNLLVGELNTLVKTSVVAESDGSLTVFIGSGQSLVQGGTAARFAAVPSTIDPLRNTVALLRPDGSGVPLPENLLTGGKLGGLLSVRSGSLDTTQSRLNDIASTLANDFNDQHRLGVDLNGVLGGAFFNVAPVSTLPREFVAGLSVSISDPRQVAVANPVVTAAAAANTGSAKVSEVRINSTTGMASPGPQVGFAPISIGYDGAGNLVAPAGFTLSPSAFDPAVDNTGKTFTLTGTTAPETFEFSFKLAGVPNTGDSFTFSPNTAGVADNRNALQLAALQTTKTMAGNKATYQSSYAQMVSEVGNQTREARVNEAAQTALLNQSKDAREGVSGVNLDEEAANLIRFQQAYQASARVMSIAQSLFDEVLSFAR